MLDDIAFKSPNSIVQIRFIFFEILMSKLDFKVLRQKGKARVGQITLNGVTLSTPVFMPV